MGELIFGYMSHHAYWDTAAVIARDMLEGTVHVALKEVQEVKLRNTIADDVVAGEPPGVMPSVLTCGVASCRIGHGSAEHI